MKSSRFLLAGILAVLPLLALALYGQYDYYYGEPRLLANGSPDNDPIRASAVVFMLSPVFVVLFATYFAATRVLLRTFVGETLVSYLTVGAVISGVLATAIVRDDLRSSMGGAVTAFVVSFGLFFLCFALGTLAMRGGRAA